MKKLYNYTYFSIAQQIIKAKSLRIKELRKLNGNYL